MYEPPQHSSIYVDEINILRPDFQTIIMMAKDIKTKNCTLNILKSIPKQVVFKLYITGLQ